MNWMNVGSSSGTGSTPAPTSTNSKTNPQDALTNRDTFLKLLVAQLQNQNPLNPADGVEFLSQLTQISSVEQSVEMRSSLDTISSTLTEIQKQLQPNTQPANSTSGNS